ncbi:hypothetical protein D3C83_236350 [compost metagenome]
MTTSYLLRAKLISSSNRLDMRRASVAIELLSAPSTNETPLAGSRVMVSWSAAASPGLDRKLINPSVVCSLR